MRFVIAVLIGLLLALETRAQELFTVRSRTEQFVIYGTATSFQTAQPKQSMPVGAGRFFWSTPEKSTNEVKVMRLVPGLVAVSAERIKETLLEELGNIPQTSSKIHILINPHLAPNQMSLAAGHYSKGWVYSMELPVTIEAPRFSAALVQVLLTDFSNSESAGEQVDIPGWLLAGMAAHLQACSVESFALQVNIQLDRDRINPDPLGRLKERFATETPLSFDELSWPEKLSPQRMELFQDSAQLFVYELLHTDKGRQCMRRFLAELPGHKNWQFAFLRAFRSHFGQLVDVEKWWALRFVTFGARDLTKLWAPAESWQKLKVVIDVPVQIHLENDRLPVQAVVTLQEVIQEWEAARQEVTLRKTVSQLKVLRLRVHADMLSLVDGYHKVLENYLEQKARVGRSADRNRPAVNLTVLKKSTSQQLDLLDEERAKLRQSMLASTNIPPAVR